MRQRRRPVAKRAAFTYVELVIALVVMLTALSSALMVSHRSARALRTRDARTDSEMKVRRAMQRVVDELSSTGPSVIYPNPVGDFGGSVLNYRRVADFDGTNTVWGEPCRLEFEYEVGEVDDGIDNNGDGLIDEGVLVYTRGVGQPDEKRIVLCHGVRELLEGETKNGLDDNGNGLIDEAGFCLQRSGQELIVRLTVEGVDADGLRFERTASTSTRMRN